MIAPFEEPEGRDEEISLEESEEETEPAAMAKDPGEPSPEDMEEHRCTHLPFRLWCKWCIAGRGVGTPHRRKESKSMVPRFALDYFFIVDGVVK